MVSHHDQVGPFSAEKPQQLQLRDIRVLKFVDEDVTIAGAKRLA